MKNNFISKLQTLFGVTKSELIVVFVLVCGLLTGSAYRYFSYDSQIKKNYSELSAEIYHSLDSLAEAERTTYIGTDTANVPDPELAKGDTIVKKESFFPKNEKKKLPAGKININTATINQLATLPGIGEKTAQKIIEYRKSDKFNKLSDIMNVKGIGEKKYEKLKQYIEVK